LNKSIDQNHLISFKLIKWYNSNHRKLPWRETKDAYKIWLSEIILQQTRVEQGLAYYLKFESTYPTVEDLAKATEEEVLKNWQGLGYYSRARNLHTTAKKVAKDYNGHFPKTFSELKKLKGVGDYTAAAIASFAFDQAAAVVDGNVYRLLSRLFGIYTPINTPKSKKEFTSLAQDLMPDNQAAKFNQATMELGALVCSPKKPNCLACPLNEHCFAFEKKKAEELPVKKAAIKQKKRFFHYFIIEDEKQMLIRKRDQKGIWQNLYDFPLIESATPKKSAEVIKGKDLEDLVKELPFEVEAISDERKHILSHQILYCRFYHLKTKNLSQVNLETFKQIPKPTLKQYPIPILLEKYLKEETNLLSLPEAKS
jgi:A/G-specific adenine glycosylase